MVQTETKLVGVFDLKPGDLLVDYATETGERRLWPVLKAPEQYPGGFLLVGVEVLDPRDNTPTTVPFGVASTPEVLVR